MKWLSAAAACLLLGTIKGFCLHSLWLAGDKRSSISMTPKLCGGTVCARVRRLYRLKEV